MNPHFEDAFRALKRSAEHMQAAHAALVEGIDAVMLAHGEHLDLRETVERLQATVMAQSADIKALRAEVAALRNGHK